MSPTVSACTAEAVANNSNTLVKDLFISRSLCGNLAVNDREAESSRVAFDVLYKREAAHGEVCVLHPAGQFQVHIVLTRGAADDEERLKVFGRRDGFACLGAVVIRGQRIEVAGGDTLCDPVVERLRPVVRGCVALGEARQREVVDNDAAADDGNALVT